MAGSFIPLDKPNIFYASLVQQSNSVFPRSPFEASLNAIYRHQEFIEDIFKVIRRTGHTRLVVKILQEAIQKLAPPEVADDPNKMTQFYADVRTEVETTLKNLNPEDALVLYDTAEVSSASSAGDKADYSAILDTMSGMLASSLKTMPSILGMRIGGSQSLSNTESMVFLKLVEGIRTPVETVLSRALTLALRLTTGADCYVHFRFNPIELRSPGELSAHKSVELQTTLRQLSMGWLSDDQAAHLTNNFPRSPDAQDVSGTGFMDSAAATQPKDMQTNQDGAQQGAMNENKKKGAKKSNGGGSPNG